VIRVPGREPLVECVVCQQGGLDGIPKLSEGITDITHARLPFHSLVSLALNTRVWADIEMRADGCREIARIVPHLKGSEDDLDRSLWGIGFRPKPSFSSLDVQLANGQKVGLLSLKLHEHPWPKRSRKALW
jgi:hypothetical protein